MPKVTIKNTRAKSMTSFWCFYCYLLTYITLFLVCVCIVDFEEVNVSWVKTIQKKKSFCEITLGADFLFRSWGVL